MPEHAKNKKLVSRFLTEIALTEPGSIEQILAKYSHDDCVLEIFHPFNTLCGTREVAEKFWRPLKQAFPDYEYRMNIIIANEYEGRDWVSALGHIAGSFFQHWIAIPPTQGLIFLRCGLSLIVRDGKIAKAYVLLDILDLMRQADLYPLRRMPGSAEQWPAPPACTGVSDSTFDGEQGAKTLAIVREMHAGLQAMDLTKLATARSEERRVGKECIPPCRSRWSPYH